MFHKNYGLEITIRRKEHFKKVFDSLIEEIKELGENKKDTADVKSYVNKKVETLISDAFENYKKHAMRLDELNREKIQEVMPEKIENEKDYSKAEIEINI